MINTLQITLHLPAINVKSPSNAQFAFGLLVSITQFEILPDEVLEAFYVWKLFDGSYRQDEEEWEEEDTGTRRRLGETANVTTEKVSLEAEEIS